MGEREGERERDVGGMEREEKGGSEGREAVAILMLK